MKRVRFALLVLVVVVLGSLTLSNAARLDLGGARLGTADAGSRCAASVTAAPAGSGTTSVVTLSGLTSACAGKRVSLVVARADGTALSTVTNVAIGTITGGTATITVPVFNAVDAAQASVTIGTWGIPAVWKKPAPAPLLSCTVPSRPDVKCTVKTTLDKWDTGFNLSFVIDTKPVVQGAVWRVTINTADPALPQPVRSLSSELPLASGMSCSSLPLVTFEGLKAPGVSYPNDGSQALYLGGHTTPQPGAKLNCP